jgi:hypothetical protein
MTKEEAHIEAQRIAEDIYEEHGEFAPHGLITLEEAKETVCSYGYEGSDLEDIAMELVAMMEGNF